MITVNQPTAGEEKKVEFILSLGAGRYWASGQNSTNYSVVIAMVRLERFSISAPLNEDSQTDDSIYLSFTIQ